MVIEEDAKLIYHCDAYNYVLRQTSGGSYFRLILKNGLNKLSFSYALLFKQNLYSFLLNILNFFRNRNCIDEMKAIWTF